MKPADRMVIDFSDLANLIDSLMEDALARHEKAEKKKTKEKEIQDAVNEAKKPLKSIIPTIGTSIYISHPFSGNEKENMKKSEELAAELVKKFPCIAFFNPLSMFRYLDHTGLSYDDCMKHCMYWMFKCDGVLMAPGWKKSTGCNAERREALRHWMPVWDDISVFAQHMSHTPDNGIFGSRFSTLI